MRDARGALGEEGARSARAGTGQRPRVRAGRGNDARAEEAEEDARGGGGPGGPRRRQRGGARPGEAAPGGGDGGAGGGTRRRITTRLAGGQERGRLVETAGDGRTATRQTGWRSSDGAPPASAATDRTPSDDWKLGDPLPNVPKPRKIEDAPRQVVAGEGAPMRETGGPVERWRSGAGTRRQRKRSSDGGGAAPGTRWKI